LPSHLSFRPPLSIPWIPFAITVDIVKTQRQRCPCLVESHRDRLLSVHSLIFLIISFFLFLSFVEIETKVNTYVAPITRDRNARTTREIFVSSFSLLFILDFISFCIDCFVEVHLLSIVRSGRSTIFPATFRQIVPSRILEWQLSLSRTHHSDFIFTYLFFFLHRCSDIFIARFSRGTGGTSYGSFASFATAKMKVGLEVYGHV